MKLNDVLMEQLVMCWANPGRTRKVELKHGLEVFLRYSLDQTALTLVVARVKIAPAIAEWATCNKCLPAHLRNTTVTPNFRDGEKGSRKYFLGATWDVVDGRPVRNEP